MPNGYFNGQVRSPLPGGNGTTGFVSTGGAKTMPLKVKPGFNETAQGKTQPTDRSGGVTRAQIHPKSDGI